MAEEVLRLVVFGDRVQVIEAGAGKFLFRLNIFQDRPDSELLSLPGQPKSFFSRLDGALGGRSLVPQGLDSREALNDLSNNIVARLLIAEPGDSKPRIGGMNTTTIQKPAGTDPPAQCELVVFRFTKAAGRPVPSAAEPPRKYLSAQRRNERSVNGPRSCLTSRLDESATLL